MADRPSGATIDWPWAREHALAVTGLLTLIAYLLVGLTFAGVLPWPSIGRETSELLARVVTVLNGISLTFLLAGVYYIHNDRVARHRTAMLASVATIALFLVVYLQKVGGGGTMTFDGPAMVGLVYFPMLAIHLLLSALAVPLVSYALVVGLVTPIDRLPETAHPRIGRWAAGTWTLSLVLGIVTHLLLTFYGWEYVVGPY
ncbi:DUF420 domain-containing protein [Halococcoides cellulosivorans]|uniref:DUF420 domain-containing protein n=2 Tax=Halococcoides cellulosivorans TaxID=1679096 RepID=A0A2R4X4E0_9EURY|nr:DUF420 domain-containing protein [Halococcoides cellulosivorans]